MNDAQSTKNQASCCTSPALHSYIDMVGLYRHEYIVGDMCLFLKVLAKMRIGPYDPLADV